MPDIVQEFTVKVPQARVFLAMATPKGLSQWWTKKSAGDPEKGSEYTLDFGPDYEWKGRVTRFTPDSAFELEMTKAQEDWVGTRVGCELRPQGENSTRVRFYHTGWPTENEHWRVSCYCWAMYLRVMRRFLEHGESVAYENRLDACSDLPIGVKFMRIRLCVLFVWVAASLGCQTPRNSTGNPQPLTPEQRAAVEAGVRRFVSDVAHDVTQEGPSAWRKHFGDTPSFFMASEGSLVFANSQAATAAIQNLARTIKHIDLRWGADLRIDPLTSDLAVVATPFTEVRSDVEGHQVTESGFFTGVAELQGGRWQFRNAHWSVPVPPRQVP